MRFASFFQLSFGRSSCPRLITTLWRGPLGVRTDSISLCDMNTFDELGFFFCISRIYMKLLYHIKTTCQALLSNYGALHSAFKEPHVILSRGYMRIMAKNALILLFFAKMGLNLG